MLYAGNNLDKARRVLERTVKHRLRIRLTIRQRTRVLDAMRQRIAANIARAADTHRHSPARLPRSPND
jgi:hypothetical protein